MFICNCRDVRKTRKVPAHLQGFVRAGRVVQLILKQPTWRCFPLWHVTTCFMWPLSSLTAVPQYLTSKNVRECACVCMCVWECVYLSTHDVVLHTMVRIYVCKMFHSTLYHSSTQQPAHHDFEGPAQAVRRGCRHLDAALRTRVKPPCKWQSILIRVC